MNKLMRYPAEFREREVQMVVDQESEHSSLWATIYSIADTRYFARLRRFESVFGGRSVIMGCVPE